MRRNLAHTRACSGQAENTEHVHFFAKAAESAAFASYFSI